MNTVIFDLGKVLVEYDWKHLMDRFRFDERTYQKVAEAIFLSDTWQQGDAGVYDETTWLEAFIENAPDCEAQIRQVYGQLSGCVWKYPYTDELIAYYRSKGFRIYYLSNYSEYLRNASKDVLSFLEQFDGGVFSYEEKCIKPEEKIYKILLERYDIKPEDALFYDDRDENTAKAWELGICGITWVPGMEKTILKETT